MYFQIHVEDHFQPVPINVLDGRFKQAQTQLMTAANLLNTPGHIRTSRATLATISANQPNVSEHRSAINARVRLQAMKAGDVLKNNP